MSFLGQLFVRSEASSAGLLRRLPALPRTRTLTTLARTQRSVLSLSARLATLTPVQQPLRPALLTAVTSPRWYSPPSSAAAEAEAEEPASDGGLPTRFDQIQALSPRTQDALKNVFKYEEMSKVQQEILGRMPISQDLLVKAKTGTGKTLGFLIPAIETILKESDQTDLARGRHVGALIISPTRELANQIADEAEKLASRHRMGVMTMVGGTQRRQTLQQLNSGYRSDIVVCTPGRVIDLLNSSREFNDRVSRCKTLILDEADELLKMGFREDVRTISNFLPKDRHSFLFSATLNSDIQSIARDVLKPNHIYVDTVDPNDVAVHKRVQQQYANIPSRLQLRAVYEMLTKHRERDSRGRIMVFLPTTAMTHLYSNVLRRLGLPVFGLHSQLSQNQRSRISQNFRRSPGSILVTTDVSARGVDYPDVGLVLQVGIPQGRDEYIHRVGRTGRAGKSGEGIIMLNNVEMPFLDQLHDLNMQPAADFGTEFIKQIEASPSHVVEQQWLSRLDRSDHEMMHDAFMSTFGFYGSRRDILRCSGDQVVNHVTEMFVGFGLTNVPQLSEDQLTRYGLGSRNRGGGGSRFGGRGRGGSSFGGRGGSGGGFGGRSRGGFGGGRGNDSGWGFDQGGSGDRVRGRYGDRMNDDAGFGGSFGRYGGDKRGRNMSGGSDGGFGGGRNEGGNRRSSSSFSGSNWGSDGGDFGSANSQREVQNRYKNSSADDIFGGKY